MLVLALLLAYGFKDGTGCRAKRNRVSAAALISFLFEVFLLALVDRPFLDWPEVSPRPQILSSHSLFVAVYLAKKRVVLRGR
ncbi:MAG: hypothetical protein ACJA1Q_002097 [Pseudohongiellaceae bacterium]|jgi:hypothetical protein